MKATIEIEISEETVKACAQRILNGMFEQPSYRGDVGAAGYEHLKGQVREVVASLDLRDIVRAEAAKLVNGVVRDVVMAELKRKVKDAVKKEHEDGTLLLEDVRDDA